MNHRWTPKRGRGAGENPPNRFEKLSYQPEPSGDEGETSLPETQWLKDSSRSAINYNDSPDVGFDASLNPYRGCEHGCVYCLSGDTAILMANGTTKPIEEIRIGDEIYGTRRHGWYRHYVKTRVLAHWSVAKPAYGIELEDGTHLIASGDHRFLTERGWKHVIGAEQGNDRQSHLTKNNKLMGIGSFTVPPQKDQDYKRGYLCGLIRGDGLLASYKYERAGRAHGNQYQFRLALADGEALQRAHEYLLDFDIPTHWCIFQNASRGRKPMQAIRTHAQRHVERAAELIAWPTAPSSEWGKGFLAGMFDAEGCYSGGIARLSNTDPIIIDHVARCLNQLGFAFAIETVNGARIKPIKVVRLCGGLREHFRLFHAADPAISRKRNIEGQAVKGSAKLGVISIEPVGDRLSLFDITTGTGDFIANGVVSHNCYARPTHEYLGFSSGIDFETKILVKEDAPELLRRDLSSPSWKPQVLAMSGVTDPYQPLERSLGLTRKCLEVLLEFRNPVVIITKNHLVTRDVDLLTELARYRAAAVFLSVTTLEADLARIMEPRASTPELRLDAIRTLSQAGVPAGVMVAPTIPGLTDHEMPSIIAAAAQAGARCAGYVVLRLPHAVKVIFEHWLEEHMPDRKAKVLNRIRAVRGGKLNDPRFGNRMKGEGIFAEQIAGLFKASCRKAGILGRHPELSTAAFRRSSGDQLSFFD